MIMVSMFWVSFAFCLGCELLFVLYRSGLICRPAVGTIGRTNETRFAQMDSSLLVAVSFLSLDSCNFNAPYSCQPVLSSCGLSAIASLPHSVQGVTIACGSFSLTRACDFLAQILNFLR